jgi:WD40 repeat protein
MTGSEVKQGTVIRDIIWSTFTCVYGWPVKGIWTPGSNYTEINCVSCLPDLGVLATGDESNRVNLFRYPSLANGALYQSYVGHSGSVIGVKFSYNRRHLVSIGSTDQTILIWKHELEYEEDSDNDNFSVASSGSSKSSNSSNGGDALVSGNGLDTATEDVPADEPWSVTGDGVFSKDTKPWKSAAVEPTRADHSEESTDCDFDLKWVHGYRSQNVCNNVYYSARSEIVYHAARVCIVYNRNQEQQRFLLGAHSDDIYGLAVHPNGTIFASSDQSPSPSVIVWDSTEMKVTRRLQGIHCAPVSLLAFNSRGRLLATIGQDENNTLVVHNHENGAELMRTPVSKRRVTCACFLFRREQSDQFRPSDPAAASHDIQTTIKTFSSQVVPAAVSASTVPANVDDHDVIVTGGYKGVTFWFFNGQNSKSQKGLWGHYKKSNVYAVASGYEGSCVTAHADGSLVLWSEMRAVFHTKSDPDGVNKQLPHFRKIRAIWAIQGEPLCFNIDETQMAVDLDKHHDVADIKSCARFVTGDDQGIIAIWCMIVYHGKKGLTYGLHCISAFSSATLTATKVASPVRSLCARDGSLLVGLLSCEIVQVKEADIEYTSLVIKDFMDEMKRKRRSTVKGPSIVPGSRGETPYNRALNAALSTSSLGIAPTVPTLTVGVNAGVAPVTLAIYQQGVSGELLVSGHNGEGELCALAMCPKSEYYFTAGDDCTLRCWTYKGTHELLSFSIIPSRNAPVKCRSIDIHPDESIGRLALGLTNGDVYTVCINRFIYEKGLKKVVQEVESPQLYILDNLHSSVKCVKYSFDGSFLAVSTLDGFVHLFRMPKSNDDYKYTEKRKFQALTFGSISHMDFGVKLSCTTVEEPMQTMLGSILSPRGVALKETRHVYTTLHVTNRYLSDTKMIEKSVSKVVKTYLFEDGSEVLEDVRHEAVTQEARHLAETDICLQTASSDTFTMKMYLVGKIMSMGPVEMTNSKSSKAPKSGKDLKLGVEVLDLPETPTSLKDAWWATWSLPFGWPVQGIWPAVDDGTTITAVARANSWATVPVVSAVDEFGRLRLFCYPSVIPGSPDKCYRGHSKHITNIKFAPDDSFCVTTGGSDRCVFVWGTDICDAVRELYANTGSVKESRIGITRSLPVGDEFIVRNDDGDDIFEDELESIIKIQQQGLLQDQARGGSSRSHPWRRLIREPSEWVDNDKLADLPDKSLELKYVYGYHGWDCTNNIGFTESSSTIVYHIAGVGIVLNQDNGTQIHNTEHDGEICCLNVHVDGHTIVTGDRAEFPKIVVWDANTGVTISVIRYHSRGVACVAFSRSGKLVVSVGMDSDRRVAVHNHRTGALLGSGKAGAVAEIRSVSVCGDEGFVTAGKHHMTFWTLPAPTHPGGPLQSRNGIFKHDGVSRTVCSTCYIGGDAVTGLADGNILLWKDRTSHRVSGKGHASGASVNAVVSNGAIVVSGGTDGKIIVWNLQLLPTMTIDLNTSTPVPIVAAQIQALALKEDRLLIGTKASEIYDICILNPTHQCSRIVEGHGNDMINGSIGGCNGVSTHPRQSVRFVTCGDDHTVRLWNLKNDTPLPAPRHQTSMLSPAVAVAFDPEGSEIAVATSNGVVHFLPSSDFKTPKSVVAVTTQTIKLLQYSPDGDTLAVGTNLGVICLVDVTTSSCRAQLVGHVGNITGIDFSMDSHYLQSTSDSFEIMFWNTATGEQLQSASEARDFLWASQSCTLGWPMQGVWADDDTEIVACCVSPERRYLCVSDDRYRLSLFQYPLPMERVQGKHYRGHSSRVTSIRFSADGKNVLTTGGLDKSIMKWAVLKK